MSYGRTALNIWIIFVYLIMLSFFSLVAGGFSLVVFSQLQALVSFNRAALENLQIQLEERDEVKLFADATQQFAERKKKLKKRAILSMGGSS